jgi:hypothetical protein
MLENIMLGWHSKNLVNLNKNELEHFLQKKLKNEYFI